MNLVYHIASHTATPQLSSVRCSLIYGTTRPGYNGTAARLNLILPEINPVLYLPA
ncbi:MAG TPA: hypothetical protein VH186_33255 [Chloroflexia bacterium]|nr:hypothetical protein [Chloroflexia bacterium]